MPLGQPRGEVIAVSGIPARDAGTPAFGAISAVCSLGGASQRTLCDRFCQVIVIGAVSVLSQTILTNENKAQVFNTRKRTTHVTR